jgi:glucosylceramidase
MTTPDPMYRMAERPDLHFSDQKGSILRGDAITVSISDLKGQTIEGFGGTFTEAAATLFDSLDEAHRDTLMEAYYGEAGIGYTLGKVPINSNDFARKIYSLDDQANDMNLDHFDHDASHDAKSLIPMILEAQNKLAATTQKEDMHLLAVPWSPPGWMKTNLHMEGSKDHCLGSKMGNVWARYISQWISAYDGKGIPVWAVTPQNDPTANKAWEACRYSAKEMRLFQATPPVSVLVSTGCVMCGCWIRSLKPPVFNKTTACWRWVLVVVL